MQIFCMNALTALLYPDASRRPLHLPCLYNSYVTLKTSVVSLAGWIALWLPALDMA